MSIPTLRFRFQPDTPRLRARVFPSIPPLQPALRSNGTNIQWKIGESGAWQDLVAIGDIDASVTVGTVTTLAPGSAATVTNVGTEQDAILDFGIPAGFDGEITSIEAGTGIDVDVTDPAHPIVAVEANLQTWNTVAPSVDGKALVAAANYAAMRALLDLEAGTDFYSKTAADAAFQPLDSDLTTIATGVPGNNKVFGTNGSGAKNWYDWAATQVSFTPAGTVAAVTVQAAIEELDAEKVPVPTSSTLPVKTVAWLAKANAGSLTNNSTISGANLVIPIWDASAPGWAVGGTQTGTWLNISGVTLDQFDAGLFVRTA